MMRVVPHLSLCRGETPGVALTGYPSATTVLEFMKNCILK